MPSGDKNLKGPANPRYKHFEELSYRGKHTRIVQLRGPASNYDCWRCLANRAGEWATVHLTDGNDPWSDYVPLCVPCHNDYDRPGPKQPRTQCGRGHELNEKTAWSYPSKSGGVKLVCKLCMSLNPNQKYIGKEVS